MIKNNKENYAKIPNVPFYFIRHGQTDWNKEHRGMGQADIPINEFGLKQAQIAAQNIAHLEISKIISSPLTRAKQTSEIIASALNKPIIILEELKECSWGIMEGKNKGDGEWVNYWRAGGLIEGAETWNDFELRIATGLALALNNNIEEKPVLIVAHGGVYWAIQEILKLQSDGDIPNCCPVFHMPSTHDHKWNIHTL